MNSETDPFKLSRFLDAQEGIYDQALNELRGRKKQSHWIWYVLPQLRGLGDSHNSIFYGISSIEEAAAYLKHPILGERLVQTVNLAIALKEITAEGIFGRLDAMKFRSSLTLFGEVNNAPPVFKGGLVRFFAGSPDQLTLKLIRKQNENWNEA